MSIKKNNASSNIVYKGLRDDILSLKLIPGSAISETDIASKYNVSRTPVRDAFKALSNEGLLEVKPHVGTFVSLMDINQISDVLYVRKVVELSILKDLANSLTEADELRLKFNLNEQKIFLLNTADSEDSVNDFIKYDNSFHKLIFHIAGKENIWNISLWKLLSYFIKSFTESLLSAVFNKNIFCSLRLNFNLNSSASVSEFAKSFNIDNSTTLRT